MKKFLSVILVAALLLACVPMLPIGADAASGTCGENLTWTLDSAGTLTISGTGPMKDYSIAYSSSDVPYINYPWKSVVSSIKTVVIEDGVTYIGNHAFSKCTSLTSVTIPDGVTSIGSYAFEHCTSLTSVTIPDGVTSIGNSAFDWCTSLTSVTMPEGVTSIGANAFYNCEKLTSLNIPDSVTSIGHGAFNDCKMTSVTIPDGVTSIDFVTFQSCDNLTSITIPDSVTSIGESAFRYCYKLTRATIGNSVTSIGERAFHYCNKLTSVTIPDSVTSIGTDAFGDCISMTDVYYSGTQTQWNAISIGSGNEKLTSVTIHYNHIHDYSLFDPVRVESCEEIGYVEYTCAFGETYREEVPALGHTAGSNGVVTPPTCTEQGYTAAPCIRCGVEAKKDYVDALGHDYTGKTIVVSPTCTEEGYTGTKCIRCDSVGNTNAINALGHKMVVVPAVPATCIQTGLTAGSACERCGLVGVAQNEIPATGHSHVNGTCTACGDVLSYTVVFKNWDGAELSTEVYHYGDTVTAPADPTRAEDDTYTYTFAGWDKEIVPCAGDAVYTATYNTTYVDYAVTFQDWDGTVLSTEVYHYGDPVTAPADPTRAEDDTYTYTFAGWDKEVVACDGNAVYTATYNTTYIDYTVTFQNWDGTLITTQTYHYGDTVTAPADPTREADNIGTYTFAGWDKEIVPCVGDAVYTATYNTTYIDYTVTFQNWDGTVLSSQIYHYGDAVIAPADPSREADDTCKYIFVGWDKEVVTCAGDAVYTAVYTVFEPSVGDANSDGKINEEDVSCIMKYLAGWDLEIDLEMADVNGDGVINTKDSLRLLKYLNGYDVTLG